MLRHLSWRDKSLPLIVVTLLIATGMKADPANYSSHSFLFPGHNFRNSALYMEDTAFGDMPDTVAGSGFTERGLKERHIGTSGYIRREKNSDLVIAIPEGVRSKYKIRFFDAQNGFLFEIRQIHDALLIVEKYNFGHAGWFQYELFKDNVLVERNTFLIKTD